MALRLSLIWSIFWNRSGKTASISRSPGFRSASLLDAGFLTVLSFKQ